MFTGKSLYGSISQGRLVQAVTAGAHILTEGFTFLSQSLLANVGTIVEIGHDSSLRPFH